MAPFVSLPFWQRAGMLWPAALLLGAALVHHSRRVSPGIARLAIALPLILLNAALPFLFPASTEILTRMSCFIGNTAITNFKLLAWVANRGVLTLRELNRSQFYAVYALPITPSQAANTGRPQVHAQPGAVAVANAKRSETTDSPRKDEAPKPGRMGELRSPNELLSRVLGKALAISAVVYISLADLGLPRFAVVLMQGLGQYLGLSLSMDASGALVGWLLDLPVAPHFDNPYASTSPSDFWNKRWNLVVSNVLRFLVYDPIMEGRFVKATGGVIRRPPGRVNQLRRAIAVTAVFAVSGIMHEIMFWYLTGAFTPGFIWMTYFVMWGPILIVEGFGRRFLRKNHIQVPTWLAWLATMIIVNAAVAGLWWPPAEMAGLPQQANEATATTWRAIAGFVEGSAKLWKLQSAEN